MSVDFAEAALRHWTDAGGLFSQGRWPNADQLYGLTAECGLKAVMVAIGLPTKPDGDIGRPHRVHADKLWDEFSTFASGAGAAHYAGMLSQPNPFADWDTRQRYWHSRCVGESAAREHQMAAQEVMAVLEQARIDGRIA